mgnify:CR=1 FL=1
MQQHGLSMHPGDNLLIRRPPRQNFQYFLRKVSKKAWRSLRESAVALLPIVVVIGFFQLVVLKQPIPDMANMLAGALMVVVGLAMFVRGLQMALFPIGEDMANKFVRRGNLRWLLVFAFALGCTTTVAEPALIAIANVAADIAADGEVISDTPEARSAYAIGLRMTVALSVGLALVLGVFRILKGWPVQYLVIGGYIGVVMMTWGSWPCVSCSVRPMSRLNF